MLLQGHCLYLLQAIWVAKVQIYFEMSKKKMHFWSFFLKKVGLSLTKIKQNQIQLTCFIFPISKRSSYILYLRGIFGISSGKFIIRKNTQQRCKITFFNIFLLNTCVFQIFLIILPPKTFAHLFLSYYQVKKDALIIVKNNIQLNN